MNEALFPDAARIPLQHQRTALQVPLLAEFAHRQEVASRWIEYSTAA
ncbi:hypothetical protein AB0M12_16090 [Nocardia vinacea]